MGSMVSWYICGGGALVIIEWADNLSLKLVLYCHSKHTSTFSRQRSPRDANNVWLCRKSSSTRFTLQCTLSQFACGTELNGKHSNTKHMHIRIVFFISRSGQSGFCVYSRHNTRSIHMCMQKNMYIHTCIKCTIYGRVYTFIYIDDILNVRRISSTDKYGLFMSVLNKKHFTTSGNIIV